MDGILPANYLHYIYFKKNSHAASEMTVDDFCSSLPMLFLRVFIENRTHFESIIMFVFPHFILLIKDFDTKMNRQPRSAIKQRYRISQLNAPKPIETHAKYAHSSLKRVIYE